jgi:hypothetical protein
MAILKLKNLRHDPYNMISFEKTQHQISFLQILYNLSHNFNITNQIITNE